MSERTRPCACQRAPVLRPCAAPPKDCRSGRPQIDTAGIEKYVARRDFSPRLITDAARGVQPSEGARLKGSRCMRPRSVRQRVEDEVDADGVAFRRKPIEVL